VSLMKVAERLPVAGACAAAVILVTALTLVFPVISVAGGSAGAPTSRGMPLGRLWLGNVRVIRYAVVIHVTPPWGTIDDGVKDYILSALKYAESHNYALIMCISSYGGLLEAAFAIGDAFARSTVPVIAYVCGGKALSAATMIILPANIIALSPNSIIGAMQPIMYNPLTGSIKFINESKIINPVVAKATYFARIRGRNVTAAKLFVIKSLVLTARQAVKEHVANLIVNSMSDLLNKLRGMIVNTTAGPCKLEIVETMNYPCSIRDRFISALENPMVGGVLMTIGILGTIFALVSGKLPIIPIALLFLFLGLVGSGFNPNIISILLIAIGAVMLAVELFVTPGFGVIGITGIVLIAIGVALSPAMVPAGLSPPTGYVRGLQTIAAVVGGGLGGLTGFILYKVIKAKRSKPEEFTPVGKIGRAIDDIGPDTKGFVIVDGEYWRAVSDVHIKAGTKVVVEAMEGAVLRVRPLEEHRSS